MESQEGHSQRSVVDGLEPSGKGEVEKTWGRDKALFPALSSSIETPCPSESSWSPQDGHRQGASGDLGAQWASHSPAHSDFSFEREKATYLMLMGLPGALDPGLPSLRTVTDFPESHLVGEGQTEDTETRAVPVRTAHPRHPREVFKRRQLGTGLGASGAGAAFRRRRGKPAREELRVDSL